MWGSRAVEIRLTVHELFDSPIYEFFSHNRGFPSHWVWAPILTISKLSSKNQIPFRIILEKIFAPPSPLPDPTKPKVSEEEQVIVKEEGGKSRDGD